MALNIISREAWKAVPSGKGTRLLEPPVDKVFVMNTNTKPCRNTVYCDGVVRRLQHFHTEVQRGPDIRYNFLIGGDGTLYEGRGWDSYPDLPKDYKYMNKESICIGYIGSFRASDVPPNMVEVGKDLVEHGVANGLITKDFEFHDITVNEDRPIRRHEGTEQ